MTDQVKNRLSFLVNTAFFAVVAVLVYLCAKYVVGWVLPFVLAFIIVSVVHPLVRLIVTRLRINQKVVSLLVMLLIYLVVAMLIFLLVVQIATLLRDGLPKIPEYYDTTIRPSLEKAWQQITVFIRDLPPEWQNQIEVAQGELLRTLQSFLVDLSQRGVAFLSSMTTRVPSFMIAFVFTIMLSFFIGMQYDSVLEFFKVQMSPRVKHVVKSLRGIVRETIIKYFRAAITLMIATLVQLSVGLLFLGTKNAIPIAAGIAVFDALPFFGTGAIMIPWCVVELLQGNYSYAFGLAILYAIVTFVRNIIEPKVVGDKLGLNPIVSLSAVYLGFKLFGVLGMIFMPICTQIAMELHKNGTIRLFRETVQEAPVENPKPNESGEGEDDDSVQQENL